MYIVYSLFSKYILKLIFNEISLVFFFFIKRMTGFVSEETYISCYMYVYNFHLTLSNLVQPTIKACDSNCSTPACSYTNIALPIAIMKAYIKS